MQVSHGLRFNGDRDMSESKLTA
eukprot:COSAG01_NODE_62509_length_284_cov_0.837838_2_plen_22_part_01